MLLRLIIFEWRYYTRQLPFRLAVPGFFLLGLMMSMAGFSALSTHQNAPVVIAFTLGILSLGTPMLIALFTGSAILRDHEFRLAPIVFTTQMTRFQYLISRFSGLFLSSTVAFAPTIFGYMLGHFFHLNPQASFGPFMPLAYLWAGFAIILPNILLGCAVIFATAALTKNGPATYLSGVCLYILYFTMSMLGNSPLLASSDMKPDQLASATLLDPYGLVGIFQQVFLWTDSQRQQAYLTLEGPLLFNRLLWVGLAFIVFALTHHFFKFRPKPSKPQKPTLPESVSEIPEIPASVLSQPHGRKSFMLAWLRQARMDLSIQCKSLPFWGFMLLWLFFTAVTLVERTQPMGTDPRPFTFVLLSSIYPMLLKLGTLIMIYYAAEMLWSERRVGFAGILEATPVANFTFWAGKATALAGMVLLLLGVTFAFVVIFQLSRGIYAIQWSFIFLIGLQAGIPLFLCSLMALAIQSQIPSKYGGLALSLIIIVAFSGVVLNQSIGLNHPMLRFGFTPPVIMSAMAATAYHQKAVFYYLMYGSALTGFVSIVALLFWRRGLRKPEPTLRRGHYLAFGLCAIALLFSGSVLFYWNNIAQPYRSPQANQAWQAQYEKRYDTFTGSLQPEITAIEAQINLFPKRRAFEIEATLTLVNPHSVPLEEALLGLSHEVTDFTLGWSETRLVKDDTRFHSQHYRFASPWQPGTSRKMTYSARIERSAFQSMNRENYILAHASYIEIEKLIPFFGFDESRVLDNPAVRQKWDLTETRTPAAESNQGNWVTFRLQITTDLDQTVIAPGDLQKTWATEGRRHFLYACEQPLPLGLGIASAAYEHETVVADGIDITYYYPPSQPYFKDEILAAAATSLRFGQETFGPYPFKTYKIAAIPSISNRVGGTAYSGTVFIVEDRILLQDQRPDELNLPVILMAHETAHQWWGRLLNPADARGRSVLSETLSNYCELVIAEAALGREETYRNLDRARDSYFTQRAMENEPETPLSRVENQTFVAYDKGLHAFFVLRELMGEAPINQAMRQLLEDFPYPKRPVVEDFLERLMANAPAITHAKIYELFHSVTTYDLRITNGTFEDHPGTYQAKIIFTATKHQEDNPHATSGEPLQSWVEVALMAGDRLVKTERLFAEKKQVEVTVSSKEAFDRVVLDPRRLHLEPTHADNEWKRSR